MSSSDDFFSQNKGQTGSLKSRRKAPPPPPPRPSTSGTNASTSTYYGSSTSQRTTTSRAAPPPRRSTATQRQQPSFQASHQAPSAQAAAPTFYSTTGGYPSTSNASSATGPSYYGTPTPDATTFPSSSVASANQSTTTTNHTTTTATTHQSSNDGWYTSSTPAPANDWYSAPQQQPQPTYTDFSQSQAKSTSLAGNMDGSATSTPLTTFTPSHPATMQSSSNIDDFDNEPPLLEELGINLQHISIKTKAVVLPLQRFNAESSQVMHEDDNDLAGPLVFALLLGGELLLMGKLQFSYIYGFGVFGCLSMTLVLNLMSPVAVSVWTVASILGYALLPVNLLALLKIALFGTLEILCTILAILTIAWCTVASTRLLEQKCGMRQQRYLVAYPIALLYSAFVMITIF